MYISHKSNILHQVHETEWQCRRLSKGLTKPEYWDWLDSITSGDPPVTDYSGETGYTIVKCIDENVQARLKQLNDYISSGFNIKWSDTKVSAVLGQDSNGNNITIETHFIGDDIAKDASLLAKMWVSVRDNRNRLLAETDWIVTQALEKEESISVPWKTYRESLRNVPEINNNVIFEQNIIWPEKPE
jgi:hypothetical protein